MEKIIEKYYLLDNSYLVNWQHGTLGVDCWFDTETKRQHRVLSFDDFESINPENK
jgi:hypothetical protein